MDKLDPKGLISHRLFREHCSFVNGIYIKDLSIVNRDLKDTILIDNNPVSYALHTDNGLPIKSWYDDTSDLELTNLLPILEFLAYTSDIRNYMKKFIINNNISYQEAFNLICITNEAENEINDNNTIINENEHEVAAENHVIHFKYKYKQSPGKQLNNHTSASHREERKNSNASNNIKTTENEESVNNTNSISTSNKFISSSYVHRKPSTSKQLSESNINSAKTTDKSSGININIINNHINNYIIDKEEKEKQHIITTTNRDKVGILNSFRTNFATSEESYRKNTETQGNNNKLNLSTNKNNNNNSLFNKLSPSSHKGQTNRNIVSSSLVGNTSNYTSFLSK